MKKIIAISTGPETHLDHLAPLCALLEVPLIVTDPDHLQLGQKFYPMIDIRYVSPAELTVEYIASFEAIIECGKFWAMELKPLVKMFFNKELRCIFAPHGYSDKESFLEECVEQDIELTYNKHGKNQIPMGNLRYWFYQKHKEHFDALAAPYFTSNKTTVLYAPTWESKATGTSFFEKTDEVIRDLSETNLLIKLHPLLEENHPAHFHRILGKYENEATFILNFPPIYPLLEKTDVYLGDYSSIGYDFLIYDRPMFFLKEGGDLQRCGELFSGSIKQGSFPSRKALAEKIFGKGKKIKALLELSRAN